MNSNKSKVCVALDVDNEDEATKLIKILSPYVGMFKVGLELYTKVGPKIIETIQNNGSEVFLDLKYHDIPTTVAKAAAAATHMGISMFNIHASGGSTMMRMAADIVQVTADKLGIVKPKLIAVTVLTSTNQDMLSYELLIPHYIDHYVPHLANLAKESGLDGIVCSPKEVKAVKSLTSDSFLCVTPGIRLPSDNLNDQVRITTPREAIHNGSDYIVIGRSITHADDPVFAAKCILDDIST